MQYYTPSTHTLTSDDEMLAGSHDEPSATYRNFLFLIPEGVSTLETSIVQVAARRLSEAGYVYMAVAGQHDMEDRENIRYMSLNEEALPCFGLVTTVVVLHHQTLAERALELYPDAQVYLLNPRFEVATQEEAPVSVPGPGHYFSHLRPWLMTGQMTSVRNHPQPTVISIPADLGGFAERAQSEAVLSAL